jgi:hypothetical protein
MVIVLRRPATAVRHLSLLPSRWARRSKAEAVPLFFVVMHTWVQRVIYGAVPM